MKATANKVILYDDHCPMCALYTRGFVKWGVLDQQNRVAFTEAGRLLNPEAPATQLDALRARHEIPLIDLAGGPTLYGVRRHGVFVAATNPPDRPDHAAQVRIRLLSVSVRPDFL